MKKMVVRCRKKYTGVFTNKLKYNIIKSIYNPLNVNCKTIYKKEEFMKEKVVLNEVIKELNIIERIFFKNKFIKVYKKGITFGFNSK